MGVFAFREAGAKEDSQCSIFNILIRVSLIAQKLKNLPAMRETWVLFLGWEDTLEKGMVTHSTTLAWRIP